MDKYSAYKAIYKAIIKQAAITLDINLGDILLGGRFKNMKTEVKDIGTDELGQPTINGKKLLAFRIAKLMPNKTEEDLKKDTKYKMLDEA